MEYVRYGKSDLMVSKLCVGTMGFGDLQRWGRKWLVGEKEALDVIRQGIRNGINWYDTANSYSLGASEEILGNTIRKLGISRNNLVIQTKVNQRMRLGPNQAGSSRKAIMAEIDQSLRRLQMDYVDVYILHRWDWETPIEETMEAMNDVVKAGKARYIGASAMFAWQFEKAYMVAKMKGWHNFICMQNHWNLLYREEEREMLWATKDAGVVCTPYSATASGRCTMPAGKSNRRMENDFKVAEKYDRTAEIDKPVIDRIEKLAKIRKVPMIQIALSWIYHKENVLSPIMGISYPEQYDDVIKAINLSLSEEEIYYLEELYQPHSVVGPLTKGQKYNTGNRER